MSPGSAFAGETDFVRERSASSMIGVLAKASSLPPLGSAVSELTRAALTRVPTALGSTSTVMVRDASPPSASVPITQVTVPEAFVHPGLPDT